MQALFSQSQPLPCTVNSVAKRIGVHAAFSEFAKDEIGIAWGPKTWTEP